jgi:pimeloyl-ACP methyl ester carboxylesterase
VTVATANAKAGVSTVRSADGTRIAYRSLGTGPGVIVVGGALHGGADYDVLATALAASFAVHVVDRRGRGGSGPQGPRYRIEKEVQDLLAVQEATAATAVVGHSYGGLIALEATRRPSAFSHVAVYEPGVSVAGSINVDWMPGYRQLLAAGDTRGAFATMVRQSGFAPDPLCRMPLWYVRGVLRLAVRGHRWRRMEPLLEANLAEHEQVARLDATTTDRYATITARVLLLGGKKSPAFATTELFDKLERTIPDVHSELLDGLDHTTPTESGAERVAQPVQRFLRMRS